MPRRAIVIVLDSVGCGALPDADTYGDAGSDTLGNIARQVPLRIPHLEALGLGAAADMPGVRAPERPSASWGKMAERSAGKDSVTGHWELMGVVLERAFPTFPQGFPVPLIADFEARIGRPVLGNVVASGTAIIEALGAEHCRTGRPIVYTSADSVFQIAAHEDVVAVETLYAWCREAYDLAVTGAGIARVIARPFVGAPGRFTRTANRHDYAMPPTGETLLDRLTARGVPVSAVGKVSDLFAGRGIARSVATASDDEGVTALVGLMREEAAGLIFVNLVDFDTKYGHRNDVAGYAANLERFDARLPEVLAHLRPDDLLAITGDHGNDPSTPSTDHSREYVPLLVTAPWMAAGRPLGVRESFADLGQTLAEYLGAGRLAHGASFLERLG
ncbi:MAG: phosphopentomutase [Vicinamibacterales bacterium]